MPYYIYQQSLLLMIANLQYSSRAIVQYIVCLTFFEIVKYTDTLCTCPPSSVTVNMWLPPCCDSSYDAMVMWLSLNTAIMLLYGWTLTCFIGMHCDLRGICCSIWGMIYWWAGVTVGDQMIIWWGLTESLPCVRNASAWR